MSRPNVTRSLLLEAFEAAKMHSGTWQSREPARCALAFLSGYLKVEEPRLSAAIDEILDLARQADERRLVA